MAVFVVAAALLGDRIASALDTPGPLALDAVAYACAAIAAVWIVGLPLEITAWRDALRAGLSRQRFPSWIADQGKALALGAVIAPLLTSGLVAALREWPRGWWLPVTLGALAVELVFGVLAPVVLVPLLLETPPLPSGPLADDLSALARWIRCARRNASTSVWSTPASAPMPNPSRCDRGSFMSRSLEPAPPAPNWRRSCIAPPARSPPLVSTGSTPRRTSASP